MNPLSLIFSGPYALLAKGIAVIAVVAAVAGFGAYQMHKYDQVKYAALQSQFDTFRGGVAALGEQAKVDAAKTDAANKLNKDRADNENAKSRRDLDALYAAYRSLRDSRARSGGGLLPSAPAGASSPDVAAFDRQALDRALSGFDRGVEVLLREGDQAIADLDTAKRWAKP